MMTTLSNIRNLCSIMSILNVSEVGLHPVITNFMKFVLSYSFYTITLLISMHLVVCIVVNSKGHNACYILIHKSCFRYCFTDYSCFLGSISSIKVYFHLIH